jgi:hypothetical protein
MANRKNNRREEMRADGRKRLDRLFEEFEFVEWEQRDVMRDFMVEQSVSNTPGIIRRFEAYLRAEYKKDPRQLDEAAKAEILADFAKWSGGFMASECDDVMRLRYLEAGLSAEFQRSEVESWLRGLKRP